MFLYLLWNSNQVCNKSLSKWADQSVLSHSNTKTNLPAPFRQKGRLAHSSLSCIWIQRKKNIKNKTLCNISNKTKTKAETMCVCNSYLMSLFPLKKPEAHMENAPVKTPIPQTLHYPSLLASPSHSNRVWKSSERPLQRQHWSSLVLNYKSCPFFFCLSA